jgi:hypothetical protein
VGEEDGYSFFRNDGTPESPSWSLDNDSFDLGELGQVLRPAFVDIDNDGDYDLFIAEYYRQFYFIRNVGTPSSPSWDIITETYNEIEEYGLAPAFQDIDGDGDYDLFLGTADGTLTFYRNDGSPETPEWTYVTGQYNGIDVPGGSAPAFADIDADGDADLFVGFVDQRNRITGLYFWRNTTSAPGAAFHRGDTNADGKTDISDAIAALLHLFSGTSVSCEDAVDVNDDGQTNIADPIALLAYLFAGGAPPPLPFLECGLDPTADEITCDSFAPCE